MNADWNLLLYAIANKGAKRMHVDKAIEDMRNALTTDRCNVAVQLHAPSETLRYWISHEKMEREALQRVDVSQSEPLTSFIDTANLRCPARSTALVLWAHSSGLDNVHDSVPGG